MRIIALSDLHLDLPEFRQRSLQTIDEVVKQEADVLIVGGDIGQTWDSLNEGLSLLSAFRGEKLAYLGNHEVRLVTLDREGMYAHVLEKIYGQYGFHLLDKGPVIIRPLAFVGNMGWYDYSLHKGPDYTRHLEEQLSRVERKQSMEITDHEMTSHCIKRLLEDIRNVRESKAVVCGIHHIASEEFLKYGHSDKYNSQNIAMGSSDLTKAYLRPEVKLGLCGHTHRSGKARIGETMVHNISSDRKNPYTVFETEEHEGDVSIRKVEIEKEEYVPALTVCPAQA